MGIDDFLYLLRDLYEISANQKKVYNIFQTKEKKLMQILVHVILYVYELR